MNRIVVGLALAISVLLPKGASVVPAVKTSQALSITAAFSLCRSQPAAQPRIWIHGWFIPSITGDGYVEGLLFNSRDAIPITTVDQWNVSGNWRKYGALYVHISTQSSFGSRSLSLHGTLDCAGYRFRTDQDPFPAPRLHTVYGAIRVAPTGAVSTWSSAAGLKLALTIPRRVYPYNALAAVAVSIRNVPRHTIGYWNPGVSLPGVASPKVDVLNSSGKIVFPPAMMYMPPLPGPAPFLAPLQPGQTIRVHEYVVIRGARIRAAQRFTPNWSPNVQRPLNWLRTQPIALRLTSEPAPRLTVSQTSAGPVVDVVRPARMTGSPLVLDYADCGDTAQGPKYDYTSGWTVAGLHIIPGCAPVMSWHLRVAWLNHPVAALDFVAPRPASTPVPTSTPTAAASPTPTTTPAPGPSFDDVLRRAMRAMASVHQLHTTGMRASVDASVSSTMRIQADCRSGSGNGIPITDRTLTTGHQTRVGKIDEGYIIEGPVLPVPQPMIRAWHRSLTSGGRWRRIDLEKQWHLDEDNPDPIWGPTPAYLNQVCPDLIRLTYLSSPVPEAQHEVLGTAIINGHQVWHLREHLWFTLDLFVDTHSSRVLRLLLHSGAGSGNHWQIEFDYLRINAPIEIVIPKS